MARSGGLPWWFCSSSIPVVAASCLRTTLELTIIGAFSQLRLTKPEFLEWEEGKREISFGTASNQLLAHPKTRPLHDYLRNKLNDPIFGQKSARSPGGWARRLYSDLSSFAHPSPTHTSAIMWEGSNGPIYIPSSFRRVYALYLDTMALDYVLVKLARSDLKLPKAAKHLFQSPTVRPSKIAAYAYKFLWGKA